MLTERQQKLAENNYNLVPYTVGNLMHLDYEEWHGIACIALCEAAQKWEPDRGVFTTYAVTCIKNRIIREMTFHRRQIRNPGEKLLSLDILFDDPGSEDAFDLNSILPDRKNIGWEAMAEWKILIKLLDDRERKFLFLHIAGYRMAEIAKAHRITTQMVSTVLIRARKKLKKAVA